MSQTSGSALPPESPTTPEHKPRLLWHNILFMTLNPLAALILAPWYIMTHGFSWGLLAFLIVTYTISNMSITCGYHRYFSHRSYNAHPLIEFCYIFFGAGAFQGSVLQWCSDHRRHHREVDTDNDPYTITKGFWYAHMSWMFRKDPHPEATKYPKDLASKPFVQFQHDYYPYVATFMGFIVPGLVGWALGFGFWGGAIIGGSFRIFLSQQSTFLINSAAHTFGRQPYTDTNTARDSWIMSVLTFGEGYHNFHHFFQADYRNGIRWFEWDPTKWFIRSLAFVGLATKLKTARKEEILKARLAMDEKLLVMRGANLERVAQLKERIVEAQARMRQLREDYLQAKKNFQAKRRQMSGQMRAMWKEELAKLKAMRKAEIRLAKNEFNSAYGQWREFRREVKAA